MEIARGVWRLSDDESTPSVVRRAGRPPDETTDDGRHVWQSANFLTRRRVTFDERTGRLTQVVEGSPLLRVAGWFGVVGVASAPILGRGVVWLGALVLVIAHSVSLGTSGEMNVLDYGQLMSYEVTPQLFLDVGVVVVAALTISVFNLVWKAALLTALAAYLLLHAAQGSIRLGPLAVGTSRAAARFRLPAVVATAPCFSVVAYELTVLVTRAQASIDLPPGTVYAVGGVSAAVSGSYATLVLYGSFETTLQEIWGREVGDTEPDWLRAVAAGLFLVTVGTNAVVLAYVADLLAYGVANTRLFPELFETTMLRRIPDAVAPVNGVAVLPLQLLPFAPLLVTWLLSTGHVTSRLVGRAWLLRKAEPLSRDGSGEGHDDASTAPTIDFETDDSVPDALDGLDSPPTILVTERDGVTARPARTLRGEPVVVLHTDLVDRLDESEGELTAVVAHEAVHLADGDQRVRLLATVATLVPAVGPNAIRAFRDYAAVERRADDAAVAVAGRLATMRAIRKVSDCQRAGPTERYRGLAGPEFVGPSVERLRNTYAESFTRVGVRRISRRVAVAYYVVFGRAVFDAVHAPVETRLSRLHERSPERSVAADGGDQRGA